MDYRRAIGPETAAILKVHPSNYKITGFTASVPERDIATIAREHEILFIHDLGSGLIEASGDAEWTGGEPSVAVAIEDGADIVTFSGDKLLGGPQAGIIVGREDLIARIARHPLLRALRVDKMTLAALQATLDAYQAGALERIPLWEMAATSDESLEQRARSLCAALAGSASPQVKIEPVRVAGLAGGGATPGAEIGSWAVVITHAEVSVAELERRLRAGDPAVIARLEDDRLVIDLRTVPLRSDESLGRALKEIVAGK
jgi:L-seryl-tRNA(Ser) seleniumtransferase